MIRFAKAVLDRISWNEKDLGEFLGRYLTEPKAHVVFRSSSTWRGLSGSLLRLDPKTQLLYSANTFFINGESFAVSAQNVPILKALADRRAVEGRRLARPPLAGLVSAWVRAGYAHLE
jgi:50S ribosomal protein L16 3-hydroxylase